LDAMLGALKDEITLLSQRYIDRYLPANPEHGPEVFEYDVKAFSLMAHAAFEEFAEGVSELMMARIVSDVLKPKVTVATVCFLMSYHQRIDIEEQEDVAQDSCFAFVRKGVDEAKRLHSAMLMNNHGFSLKYLRKILTPVGVNVPDGAELGSLQKLVEARGTFAHTMAKSAKYGDYKKASKVLSPEEARDAVDDCLAICGRIKEQANALLV
jgi:hypothetical protein